jgi:hypothetical protein
MVSKVPIDGTFQGWDLDRRLLCGSTVRDVTGDRDQPLRPLGVRPAAHHHDRCHCDGIVSKRRGSSYRSTRVERLAEGHEAGGAGREAVKHEEKDDWAGKRWGHGR